MNLTVHIDGGARGNPGPAGAGVTMCDDQGGVVFEAGFYLGEMTNNRAEYGALLKALEVAEQLGAEAVSVFADSELLVRQINGVYRVKNPGLKVLFGEATQRLGRFGDWSVQHVLRESNSRADELANMAMDAGQDVIVRGIGNRKAVDEPAGTNAAGEDEPGGVGPVVIARCVKPPSPPICPAPCELGTTYRFDRTVPAGLCVDAAAVVLRSVVQARAQRCQTNVTCPRLDCGALFEISD